MSTYVGKVIQAPENDPYDGMRIKALIESVDKAGDITNVPYAFPLLPKMMSVLPKVGESVLLFLGDDNKPNGSFRYYIGPIISQPQLMSNCPVEYGVTLLGSTETGKGQYSPLKAPSKCVQTEGSFLRKNTGDIGLYSRKNSDIILGEDDLMIRCGARLMTVSDPKQSIIYNGYTPSFVQLKYNEKPFYANKPNVDVKQGIESTATIVAQEINLVTTENMPAPVRSSEILNDDAIKQIIQDGHPMVFGDKLIDFLEAFREAFNNHTHNYGPCPPVQDDTYTALQQYDMTNFLSENIRLL